MRKYLCYDLAAAAARARQRGWHQGFTLLDTERIIVHHQARAWEAYQVIEDA